MLDVVLKKTGAVQKVPSELETTFLFAESAESSNILYLQAKSPVAVRARAACVALGAARFVEVEVSPALRDARGARLRGVQLRAHPDYWACTYSVSLPLGRVVNFVKTEKLLGGFCVWILVSGSEQMAVTLNEFKLTVYP